MKKYLSILLMTLLGVQFALAQLTAETAFLKAPMKVLPLLPTNTRLDMRDYYKAGQSVESGNNLAGKSRLTELKERTATIKMSDASDVQIIVLPAGNDTIIGLITTVKTPAPDSSVKFYDKQWKQQPTERYYEAPALGNWLTDAGGRGDVEAVVPFMVASLRYEPATETLTATNALPQFLSEDIYSMISGKLRKQLTYKWNGKRFVAK